MTRDELEDYASTLEATGLTFASSVSDKSGNLKRLVPVPWDQLIVRVARLTGYRIIGTQEEAPVTPLRLEP